MFERLIAGAVLALLGLPACNNCKGLEDKICEDLGAEDCKLWREAKGPDFLYSGSRPERGCFNARFNPMQYGPYLTGAKAVAESMRKAQQAATTK